MVYNDRRKEIINRIKKRNKMKERQLHSRHEQSPFQPHSVTTFDADEERGHPLFRKDIMLLKILIASLLFITVAIIYRYPSNDLESVRQVISSTMENELQFALVTDWYEDTFGKPIAFLPSEKKAVNEDALQVSGDYILPVKGKIIEDYATNGAGIIVKTDSDDGAYAIEDGVIIYAGIKEEYGNTVIIQHKDKSETWYGNLDAIDVKVYSQISKGEQIGVLNEEGTLFFGMKKEEADQFVDPSQVISVE
ncbi:M23 family metallopeptidase [Bacillus sp. AGMB 02131]|uniref:M23 family metallopeptidase n=1 Tax=Peribacillus faecalis TaxID=2772559 RepID=A0A927HAS2_9BACI|nr:M23 family metallopeptidase [Peribacillus faecalis]MBD3107842.1 M23 family metallopeptidase [Peribacillus faecalis]